MSNIPWATWRVLLAASPVFLGGPALALLITEGTLSGAALAAYDVAVRVVLPTICLALLLTRSGLTIRELGFPSKMRGNLSVAEFIAAAFISSFLCYTWVLFNNVLAVSMFSDIPPSRIDPLLVGGIPPIVAMIYYLSTAPFFEEVFYRGVLGAALLPDHAYAPITYILVSAVLFGAAHATNGEYYSFVSTAYFGAVAATIFVVTRNIWLVIIPHFVTDLVVMAWNYSQSGTF